MAHIGYYKLKPVPASSTSPSGNILFYSISKGQHSTGLWSQLLWIRRRAFRIRWFLSGKQHVSFSFSRACGRWCTRSRYNAERVKSCYRMASVHFTSVGKQSGGISTSNFIIERITAVSIQMDFIIPWLTTMMVIYPCHWSCLPALGFTMRTWSGKRTTVCIWKLPSPSWNQLDLIARTTSTARIRVVGPCPAVLQRVASC